MMLELKRLVESAKRAITHEDLWLMKRVSAPVPSPDGKWAVFSVAQPAYRAKDASADSWLVPLDGSAPARQLTQTKAKESGAEWSPDATRVAFSTKRDADEEKPSGSWVNSGQFSDGHVVFASPLRRRSGWRGRLRARLCSEGLRCPTGLR